MKKQILCLALATASLSLFAADAKEEVTAAAKKLGVKVKDLYWTLGQHDGVLILEAADDAAVTSALLPLGARGFVHTSTARAFSASEIDKIIAKARG